MRVADGEWGGGELNPCQSARVAASPRLRLGRPQAARQQEEIRASAGTERPWRVETPCDRDIMKMDSQINCRGSVPPDLA